MKDSRNSFIAGAALIAALALFCVASTYRVFSQTVDEPIHVAGGFEWLTTSKYEIDSEHPPLARILFALPAWFAGVTVDATADRVEQGNRILDANGMANARAGNLLFFLLAMATVALWARQLFGNATGLLALALFAALPPVLAHAGLATTDMAVTAMTITSLFALSHWLDRPTWTRSILLGLAVALGMLSKFSFLVFFPVGIVVLIIARREALPTLRPLRALSAIAVAVIVVWAGYRFSLGNLNELRLKTTPSHTDEHVAAKYAMEPGYEWVRPDLVRRYYRYGKLERVDFVDWAKAAGYPSPLAGRSGRDTMVGATPIPTRRFTDALFEPFRSSWQWIATHVPLPAPMYIGLRRVLLALLLVWLRLNSCRLPRLPRLVQRGCEIAPGTDRSRQQSRLGSGSPPPRGCRSRGEDRPPSHHLFRIRRVAKVRTPGRTARAGSVRHRLGRDQRAPSPVRRLQMAEVHQAGTPGRAFDSPLLDPARMVWFIE